MKTFKTFLMAATALSMSAGVALADDNNAFTSQTGDDNGIMIEQSDSTNSAGDPSVKNTITQDGDKNEIDITQSGSNAKVGTGGNYAHLNLGVDQLGDFNKLTITQTKSGSVNTVQQDSTGAATSPSGVVNEAIVNQLNGNGSTLVSRIDQTYTGNGTADAKNLVTINQHVSGTGPRVGGGGSTGDQSGGVFQTGYANTVDILQIGKFDRTQEIRQNGDANSFTVLQDHVGGGGGNNIQLGDQDGSNNIATVIQTGEGNYVASVVQDNTGSGSLGNHVLLNFNGNDNGIGTFSGDALDVGLSQATSSQLGDDNSIEYLVNGDSNLFAFSQDGDTNMIWGEVNGNNNQVAIAQLGNGNTSNFTQNGNNNNLGVIQGQ